MPFVDLLHPQPPPCKPVQEQPPEFVERAVHVEEAALSRKKRTILERRHSLLGRRAFFRHDVLHELIAPEVLADKNQMMTGPIAVGAPESEREDIFSP